MRTDLVPFRRGRFEELPEEPRVPHPYREARADTIVVQCPGIGKMQAHVTVHGSGPPLLLIHGLMTSSYSWRYLLGPLGQRFTLYAPDLPGAGNSEAPAGAHYHADAMADWIGAAQRVLGIRGCPVVGNSMGGYLAMRLALRDPDAMSRLVNIHSPGVPEARIYALGAVLALPGAKRLLARWVRRDPLRWAHRNVHYWDESLKSLEEARAYGEPLARPGGAEAFALHLQQTMAARSLRDFQRTLRRRRDRGERFPVPLLLLYSERDPMVPAKIGDAMAAAVPDARLVRLPEASHFAHVDAAERVAPILLDFLAAG
jgi:pimeloyl-ACP methyl ester carboxylesterase